MSYCRTVPPRTNCVKKPSTHQQSNQTRMEHNGDGLRRYQSSNNRPISRHTVPSTTHSSHQYGESSYANDPSSYNDSQTDDTQHQQESSEPGRTNEGQGSYHVKEPNPRKYAKLKETAQIEEEQYTEYNARKKERITQQFNSLEPQRVGGQVQSVEDVRKKQEQILRRANIQKKVDKEEREKLAKQAEQEKYDQYKQQQREKAGLLERRKEQQRTVDLEDLRRKRLERFA